MICVALVHLHDWPHGEPRDVDMDDEQIQGLLRGQYIVPYITARVDYEAAGEPAPPKTKKPRA